MLCSLVSGVGNRVEKFIWHQYLQCTVCLPATPCISHYWLSGALVVVLDMGLAMLSVLCNLMVITSVRRREDMMSLTFNMVTILHRFISTFRSILYIHTLCIHFLTILSKVVVTKIYILKRSGWTKFS